MAKGTNLKSVEDKIRDIINWVKVEQNEEVDGAQKISDDSAEKLLQELEALAALVGETGGKTVVKSREKELPHKTL